MQRHLPLIHRRPPGAGPFFDYVVSAIRHEALHARALRAARALHERRIAESTQRSAEQRWEGEGGSMSECAPAGRFV
jgi:hypothetical protein